MELNGDKKMVNKKISSANVKLEKIRTPSLKNEASVKMGFFATWQRVMFEPVQFYERLPSAIRYKEPSLFAIKLQAIILVLALIVIIGMATFMFGDTILSPLFGLFGGLGMGILLLFLIVLFPIVLFFSWLMLFVSAGIIHLFVILLGGKEGYHETFKAATYAMAPGIFTIIPFVGWLAVIYSLILNVIGIKKRQKLSIARSIAVVVIPLILVFLILFALMFWIFFMMNYPLP